MEPPGNHLASPYGAPPCPPMYGSNTEYNLQQQKMQDQYYERQQTTMGYPGGMVPSSSGQSYPGMGMEQNKMPDPAYSGGPGYGRPAAAAAPPPAGGDLGPMMRALTEDDMYQQAQQQAQYNRQMSSMGYGQNMSYPTSQESYATHSSAGQYPFSPGHSPRSSQFFPMHGQAASPHDGYTSPPLQSSHYGPNGPLGQYQRQSPLMNMASPNGQVSPSVPPYSRTANHPVTSPSPVMGMQGSNMYPSHGSSGHLSHNSPLPSPNNLRSPASVHSPKSLPASSPQTFASPSPSPIGTMAGQPHRQTRSPGVSSGGSFQQNPNPQPYPIPSPKVRAVEQTRTGNTNTPYVELVSTRDSPLESASNHSQESMGKAPYPQKEHSSNRGHLPQLEEMVKFLGEPTAKGILPMGDQDNITQPDTLNNMNGRHSVDGVSNSDTDSNKTIGNNESKSASPAGANGSNKDVARNTTNGTSSSNPEEDNTTMQRNVPNMVNNTAVMNTPNGDQETQDHPAKKSPRRRKSNSKSPIRRNSKEQDLPLVKENHVGDNGIHESTETEQNVEQDSKSQGMIKRRRRSSSLSGSDTQKSPKRRYRKKSIDDGTSKEKPVSGNEHEQSSPKQVKSPRRLSAGNSDSDVKPNVKVEKDSEKHTSHEQPKTGEEVCSLPETNSNPSNGAQSEMKHSDIKSEDTRTCGNDSEHIDAKPDESTGNNEQSEVETHGESVDVKGENDNNFDVPSTSRSETPPFKNPMTTPTLKKYSPESGGSGMSTPDSYKRKGRPPGSRNRSKEEIAQGKPTRKKRPYKKRSLDPELKEELEKFKHIQKPSKVLENRVSKASSGPVLRMQGTRDKVISGRVVNSLQDAQSSQSGAGNKKKKRIGRPPKRFANISRVPQGPATMHSTEFRAVGEWTCALCGKPANVGTLGHLYGPYYPHGYQIPPQPPKQDSTSKTKDEVEVEEVPPPPPPPSKGKGSRGRLKPGIGRGKGAAKQTPESATSEKGPRGGKVKRTPKAAKMDDFDYDLIETPVLTKGGRKRSRSTTPGSSSKRAAKTSSEPSPAPEPVRRRKRSGKLDDPNHPNPNEIWVHEDCAIWAQGVYAMGSTLYGLYEAVTAAKKVVSLQPIYSLFIYLCKVSASQHCPKYFYFVLS